MNKTNYECILFVFYYIILTNVNIINCISVRIYECTNARMH